MKKHWQIVTYLNDERQKVYSWDKFWTRRGAIKEAHKREREDRLAGVFELNLLYTVENWPR